MRSVGCDDDMMAMQPKIWNRAKTKRRIFRVSGPVSHVASHFCNALN